ncbi:MAG: galactokinase [Saprospiraceae bacterium]|nr:galactokinase [Saprospiraceae bacterium]
MASRLVKKVREYFQQQFGSKPVITQAPGRINIIGEHIDYSDGFVLPMAIDKYIVVAAALNGTSARCRVHAIDLNESVEWSFDSLLPDRPTWLHYIYGSIDQWYNQKLAAGGIDLAFCGDIPLGAGLSSSAALEASTALAISRLWSLDVHQKELALHCQQVEHQYAGVQCGIMDQYASIFGSLGQAILLDCQSVAHQYIACNLGKYAFLLCNTGVSHSLASSQYNLRRQSCEAGLVELKKHYSSIKSWRDVDLGQLRSCRSNMDPTTYRRCLHVVHEIDRVLQAAQALQKGNLPELGQLMYGSHSDLSGNYEVSCPELDFLVELTQSEDHVLGSRMMGGGFGGCTINLIEEARIPDFLEKADFAYRQKFGIDLESYMVKGGDGASVIS